MGAVRLLAGSDLRRRWRSVVALSLMVGVVGAIVLATAAGARRSETALSRFNAWSRSSDVELNISPAPAARVDAFAKTQDIAGVATLKAYALDVEGRENLAIAAATDGRFGNDVDRARLIKGRRADPATADEITIGESLASQLHLGVGDHLDAGSVTPAQFQQLITGHDPGPPAGPHLRLKIVGIARRPLDLGDRATVGGVVILTPAFDRKYADQIQVWSEVLRVRTQHGTADIERVSDTARQMFYNPDNFKVQGLSIETQGASGAIDVLARALWIFAAVVALAGAVVVGIVVTREFSSMRAEQTALSSLGLTRRRRMAAGMPRALVIAGSGAFLAALGAVLASPLFPIGLARRADPDPGLHIDWAVLAIGVAAIAGIVLLFSVLAVVRATLPSLHNRASSAPRARPTIVERAVESGARPTFSNGLRIALQRGRDDTPVSIPSALIGGAFGVLGVIAVLVFAASLNHLVATPQLNGWTFDFRVQDNSVSQDPQTMCSRADFGIPRDPGVGAVGAVCTQSVQVDGRPLTAWGFTQLRGSIEPEIVAGRVPTGPGEVAVGKVTLDALGKKIGDKVQIKGAQATAEYTIVGRVVLPGIDAQEAQPLADGVAFTDTAQARIFDTDNLSRFVIGRFAPGADRAAAIRRLSAISYGPEVMGIPNPPPNAQLAVPAEVNHLRQIDWFLPTLAALLGLLALLAIGHALVTAVRRRRREFALLKTLGFDRRQVRTTVAWQATTLTAIGLVVGIPLGLLAGSYAWGLVANGLGVSTTVTIPILAVVLAIPAAIALVNFIGWFPARRAARTRPAVVLASE